MPILAIGGVILLGTYLISDDVKSIVKWSVIGGGIYLAAKATKVI